MKSRQRQERAVQQSSTHDSGQAEPPSESQKKFSLDRVEQDSRRSLLAKFAEALREQLSKSREESQAGEDLRKKVLEQTSKESISSYHFDNFLRHLYREGLIKIGTYRDP